MVPLVEGLANEEAFAEIIEKHFWIYKHTVGDRVNVRVCKQRTRRSHCKE